MAHVPVDATQALGRWAAGARAAAARGWRAAALVFLAAATAAHACSCIPRSDLEQFRAAHTVVAGVVRDSRFEADPRVFGGGFQRVRVEVQETFKGAPDAQLVVIDGVARPGLCSAALQPGRHYVLFMDALRNVGTCSGTQPLAAAGDERLEQLRSLRALQAGIDPAAGVAR